MKMMIWNEKQREEFISIVKNFKLEGKKFVAEFKLYRKQRSIPQNRLYWAWLKLIEKETGNDAEVMHEFFKRRFLSWDCHDIYGEEVPIAQSTTKLDSKQFTEYIEKIKMFMYEQGVHLPSPEEEAFDDFWAQYGDKR